MIFVSEIEHGKSEVYPVSANGAASDVSCWLWYVSPVEGFRTHDGHKVDSPVASTLGACLARNELRESKIPEVVTG